jgi:hypothetical protein
MVFEILIYILLFIFISLWIGHYIIYKKTNGDDFVIRTFYLSPPDNTPEKQKYKFRFKPKMFDESMRLREILYISKYNSTNLDLEWLHHNMKIKPSLQIQAEKYNPVKKSKTKNTTEKYFIPLKEWYSIYRKKKHKEMKVHSDMITLNYFDYIKDYQLSFRKICSNYFYYPSNFRISYHSNAILDNYKRVHHYYTVIYPILTSKNKNNSTSCEIQLVHPQYNHSLYMINNESRIIANRPIDYKEYPKSRNIKYLTVKILENDALAIPYGWSYVPVNFEGICIEYNIENYAGMISRFMRIL